ncbi:hypothetical protein ACHAO8_011445 [Botrytis cinerea]
MEEAGYGSNELLMNSQYSASEKSTDGFSGSSKSGVTKSQKKIVLSNTLVARDDDGEETELGTEIKISITPEKGGHRDKGKGQKKVAPPNRDLKTQCTKETRSSGDKTSADSQKDNREACDVTEKKTCLRYKFNGIHVIGNMNFIAKMAGYIGLSTTREVHELYHTPYFQALLNDSVGKKGEGLRMKDSVISYNLARVMDIAVLYCRNISEF